MSTTSYSSCPVADFCRDFCTDWFLCRIDHCRSPSGSLSPSKPSAMLLQGPHELMCLAYGFSPASINITWLLDSTTQLQSYNTSEPHKGPRGKFSVQSRLALSSTEWLPGEIYTCSVTHSTINITLSISKPGLYIHISWCIIGALKWYGIKLASWYIIMVTLLLLNRPCGWFWFWTHLCFYEKCLAQVHFRYGKKDGNIWQN